MKATGIVRRIDNLGRVVIPKEIRNIYHIKEGDPIEIFTDGDGLILRKYDTSPELAQQLQDLADETSETMNLISDLQEIAMLREVKELIVQAGLRLQEGIKK